MKSNLKSQDLWIEVTGQGDTENKAIEDAFKSMRKKVGEEVQLPIISLKTEDVIVLNIEKEEWDESFLYLFMKRKREKWNLKMKIKLKIEYVEIEGSVKND